ncbi:acyloxyacyl hydrolase [Flavobacterium sp. LHD-85]|uniref:acyloxyacyl hydrolase n=1 Tax=Flavobacterium sp. LHD-85 TaxID=3071410 RepID=UPI0027E15A19|nr:acyloxyacyl hydrolase [Flavobacterium sp. LHD-85]MDQ6531773.1 acyloxyacyl hydrolase [Flavobacterium sp. LHD-85]
MTRKLLLGLLFLMTVKMTAQKDDSNFSLGFNYGFGSEFSNRNYTFTNHFYKVQLYYKIKETKHFQYQILVQPEINFAEHQLLNFYFVKPETPNYQQKRDEYTHLKDVREYVLNCGFLIRKPIGDVCSFYILGSIGPMITDTETERISEGFAFADVLALGFTVGCNKLQFDLRPSLRHVSNAGLGSSNAGYNTKNIEFGISYQL